MIPILNIRTAVARKLPNPIAINLLMGATHVWVALIIVAVATACKTALTM